MTPPSKAERTYRFGRARQLALRQLALNHPVECQAHSEREGRIEREQQPEATTPPTSLRPTAGRDDPTGGDVTTETARESYPLLDLLEHAWRNTGAYIGTHTYEQLTFALDEIDRLRRICDGRMPQEGP